MQLTSCYCKINTNKVLRWTPDEKRLTSWINNGHAIFMCVNYLLETENPKHEHSCMYETAIFFLNVLIDQLLLCMWHLLTSGIYIYVWTFFLQRLETDLAYWMDHYQSSDQGRQHHYDENSPMGPRSAGSYRHGANVNYDYY